MSFSNSSGGTLALPSPTHAHHIDVTSAVRTLRRSISRSPSKFLTRSNSQNSLSPESPHQTSPQSPCRRFGATPQNQQLLPSHTRSAPPHINGAPHSTAFTPFRPSVRLSLRSAKAGKTSPSRPLTRARASPKSPLKRALNMAPDSGNSLPAIPLASVIDASGQENNALGATSPISVSPVKRRSLTLDVAESSPTSFLKSLDSNNDGQMVTNNGSLKRSDATMNLDQPSQGSPVAKRRSLHGISGLGQNEDQNIFGANTTSSQSFYIHEDSSTEYEIAGTSGSPFRDPVPSPTPATTNVPKRSSSLRNSLTEEAPIYAPVARMPDRPRPHLFSRSLPLNATRPTRPNDMSKAMATPSNSQLWVGAFNSTGLISKVNRNPEEDADKKMAPPDTPCKKHSNPFATFPPPAGSAMKKRGNNRNSFGGLPSTPFGNSTGPNSFGRPGKGMSIFQRGSASRSARRGSVLSLDGDEHKLFGETIDFSTPMEGDAPPTPTKNTLTPSLSKVSEYSFESPHDNHSPTANRTLHSTTPVLGTSIPREATSSPLDGRRTPQTPRESLLPLDTSRLSISQIGDGFSDNMPPPVTPTAGRDLRSSTSLLVTPVNARTSNIDIDASLSSRFDKVEQIGKGEFSVVYRVTQADHQMTFGNLSTTPTTSPTKGRVYAVKKSKHAFQGPKDRDTKVREAEILRTLSFSEHVVQYFDHWDYNNHLYIQTEYCEEGTLDKFLGTVGRGGRLDDFRIFKILQDLCLGLKDIHDSGFMHLDLKPANILVTFEGVLKIGDFGLAQSCSSAEGVDVEGDREYMAPEMLKGKSCQSADVFSLGLIILETAANVVLPDNGPTWIALRSGDLSEVPSLTWNPSIEVQRDATGNPTEIMHSDDFTSGKTHDPSNLFGPSKRSELLQPPEFMVNATHSSSLDLIVRWMTAQEPSERPTVHQVLELEGLQWVGHHRAAPATVYEGNWGPDEELIPISIAEGGDSDTEMTDV
ncbi:mitosis inhibitor protein kinase swe1 [Fusarium oxysporum]|uniref:Mitosis inhibitor protein kinase wee1 n=1 Tax=Fusarium oxysporum f. sp. cubense (strain race 4) TaxID=2502994 RepID=N1RCM7_FUSC4|nr:Mitosis inhibitor protein kinase wee1 [Fusarium odoratissimum]KAJ4143965.1 mitosis inhibitor protein kinase swe1 [Fusarium oxysporum]KAJ4280625.1 mitosis inhibitor protein kinase swe1 [Fusarium oxysporum]